ncbi:MAG: ribonuclease HII [Synergistaceae bacterium]|nr:ribonuclease HII [Synergistaceae bacterium]
MRQLTLFDDIIPPLRCEHDEAVYHLDRLKERGVIIGTDEAGRGSLAGPVVAAAVCLTQEQEDSLTAIGLKDSKRLAPNVRERLFAAMNEAGVIWRAYMADNLRVDRDNVLNASLWAMGESVSRVAKITGNAGCVIVDGNKRLPDTDIPQWVLIRADDLIPCVSAASIAAKVIRDRLMVRLSVRYPGYGLERNKGYPTRQHIEAVRRLGLSKIHRETFCRKFIA